MLFKKKIVVTGGSGRFAQSLKKTKSKYKFVYLIEQFFTIKPNYTLFISSFLLGKLF